MPAIPESTKISLVQRRAVNIRSPGLSSLEPPPNIRNSSTPAKGP